MIILLSGRTTDRRNGLNIVRDNIREAGARCVTRNVNTLARGFSHRPYRDDVFVFCWGGNMAEEQYRNELRSLPRFAASPNIIMYNTSADLMGVSNKRVFHEHFGDFPRVPNVRSVHEITDDAVWVARTQLNAHSGAGIVMGTREELPRAQLYTKYIANRAEYRVHFHADAGEVINSTICKKRRRNGVPHNDHIRNLAGGWVYSYHEALPRGRRAERIENAVAAFCAANPNISYGALDVLWDRNERCAYLLEFNAAPGLGHTETQDFYTTTFLDIYGEV